MLVQTRQTFEGVRTALAAAPIIVVDTEGTGLLPHQGDRLCGVSTYCEVVGTEFAMSAYFPFRHKPGSSLFDASENLPWEWFRELMQVLFRSDVTLVFHNAKFDLTCFAYEGYFFEGNFECTQIMSWLNCEWESHRLKDLHDKYIEGSQSKAREAAIKQYVKREGSYANVPPAAMEPYACGDAEDTWEIRNFMLQQLEEKELTPLLAREFQFSRQLFDMEWYGIGVDLGLSQQLSDEAVARMRQVEDEMGFDPLKLDELARRLFLPPPTGLGIHPESLSQTSSPDFPNGRPEMREEFLSKHLGFPLVSSVLEYRGLVKANSTWFRGFIDIAAKSKDSRLHSTFNGSSKQSGKISTKTGRLNSSNPNVQQIPRHEEELDADITKHVKRLFKPGRQRWSLYEFDYSQIELRLASVYADAVPLLEALRAGADPHAVTAERIGCSRQAAKHATYTSLYGGGPAKLAWQIERLQFITTGQVITYPVEQAATLLEEYFTLYPGFKTIMNQATRTIRQRGYVQMWNGRRRHYERWFDPKLNRMVDNGHKAFNSIIQGGASEIIKETMLSLPRKDYAYRVVSQVHDSLWVEVVDDFREDWLDEIKWYMEWPSRDERFQIPFTVDVKLLSHEEFDPRLWEEP
jgi:DNA polymerase-1